MARRSMDGTGSGTRSGFDVGGDGSGFDGGCCGGFDGGGAGLSSRRPKCGMGASNKAREIIHFFIKHSILGGVTTLIVYVDDIIVTGNDEKEKNTLKQCLAKEFEIKDLGKLKYFLGIEVAWSKQSIFISQQKYVIDLLRETGMMARKPVATPIEQNHRLSEALGEKKVD